MDFDVYKKEVLEKLYGPDLSRKGSVDEYIIPLIDSINSHSDYVTTSSCSGRFMIYSPAEKKYDAKWLYVNHDPTTQPEDIEILLSSPIEGELWAKTEGFILHVACRDFDAAKRFMILAQQNGYKNSSILAASKKCIVQIIDSRRFDTLWADNGVLCTDAQYRKIIIQKANTLIEEVRVGIDRFFKAFQTLL